MIALRGLNAARPVDRARVALGVIAALVACGGFGCSQMEHKKAPVEVFTPLPWGTTVAVAPALNFSGSSDFDPLKVADLMASELSSIQGIGVIGVTRVQAVLADQGFGQIQSPEHAVAVCDRLGADAILVFAVTEYDPYTPVIGIAAKVYARGRAPESVGPDRSAKPFAVAGAAGANGQAGHESPRPWAQVQHVYNATHERVQKHVKEYADSRSEDKSPYGWRSYLVSQERFLRFCCFSVARELMELPPPATAPELAGFGPEREPGT